MSKKKPVVALIYDFDGTLSPLNMQEYDFLKAIGIKNKAAFWKENNELIKQHEASNILCYMKLMIDKARAAHVSIKREQFVDFGKSIELYKGVEEWFELINQIGKKEGVIIQHYINSSGLKEMIEGTKISKKFKQIYACSFMYEDGVAVGRDEQHVVENDVANRAGMEGTDTHRAAPFAREMAARPGPQCGLHHRCVEQRHQQINPHEEETYQPLDAVFVEPEALPIGVSCAHEYIFNARA